MSHSHRAPPAASLLVAVAAFAAVVPAASVFGQGLALSPPAEPFVGAHGALAPATYAGRPQGLEWRLDLWPDQAYHLTRERADGGADAFAGRWSADGRAISLALGGGASLALEVRNAQRLRPEGAPDDASGDLATEGALAPSPISLPVEGMFVYFADAAIFRHCATGRTYPVAQEADYLAAERAYLADAPAPAEPLFVTFDATIAMREQMEGPERLSVIVDAFGATWPGQDCAGDGEALGPSGVVWRILSIGGEALDWSPPMSAPMSASMSASMREPFLTLDADEGRFNASVGCNAMRGGFSLTDGALAFSGAASTLMACPEPLAAHEARLAAALAATRSYAIGGRAMRLLDANGATTAELKAVYRP